MNPRRNTLSRIVILTCALLMAANDAVSLEVRDGQFYDNGKRVKFWGVHLAPGASVAEYPAADALVSRIREMGFNAVVVWGISEMFRDGVPESQRGDKSSMDRLDYLIYKCREAGLYVWLAAATRIPNVRKSDYATNQSGSANDRYRVIHKIQTPTPESPRAQRALYLDKGFQQVKLRFITQLLTHVNPYTGKAYKDHDGLLLYLADETGFISSAAGINKHPKHGDPDLGPLVRDQVSKHGGDVQAIYTIARNWHRTLIGHIRSLAPNIPVNLDTIHRGKLFDLYVCNDADFCAYGIGGHQGDGGQSMLMDTPSFTNASGGSREFKIKGKPWIMYTGNPQSSADYRAEWPLRIAALASFQDADGVFFWYWGRAPKKNTLYSRLPPYDPKLQWDISTDEVLLAAAKTAGRIFINGYIPPAPNPVTFTLGRQALESWDYGYNWQTKPIFQDIRRIAYTTGARVELNLEEDIEFRLDRNPTKTIENPLVWENAKGDRRVIWDWTAGQLVVDTPEAKAITGFVGDAYYFSEGISLTKIDQDYIAFGLVSEDDNPISQSRALTSTLVSKGQNAGFRRQKDGTIISAGAGPAIVTRVSGEVTLPGRDYRVSIRDFSGRIIGEANSEKLTFRSETPAFVLDISRHPVEHGKP